MTAATGVLTRLVKGTALLLGSTVTGRVLAMAARVLIIRSLPPGEFGVIVLAFTITSAIAEVAVLGFPRGIAKLTPAAGTTRDQSSYLISGYALALVSGVGSAILVYYTRHEVASIMDAPRLPAVLALFAVYLLVAPFAKISIGGLRGYERSTPTAIARDVLPELTGVCLLGLLLLLSRPKAGAISYYLILPTVSLIVATWYLTRSDEVTIQVSIRRIRHRAQELINYSLPLGIERGLSLLMLHADIVLLAWFLNQNEVGLYKATQPFWKGTLLVLFSLGFLYFPAVSRYYENDDMEMLQSMYRVTTKWVVHITYPITIFIVMFAPDLLEMAYGGRYTPASTALSVLAGGMFLRVLVGPNAATIQAIGWTQIDLITTAAGVFTNICLNLLLIPRWGIVGAAVATVTGYTVYNGLELILLHRAINTHPLTVPVVLPLLPTTIITVVVATVTQSLSLVGLIVVGFFIAATHLASILATGSLEPIDTVVIDHLEERAGIDLEGVRRYTEK